MNYRIISKIADISKTIMARDYKGFGTSTETQNGVIERYNNCWESSSLDI